MPLWAVVENPHGSGRSPMRKGGQPWQGENASSPQGTGDGCAGCCSSLSSSSSYTFFPFQAQSSQLMSLVHPSSPSISLAGPHHPTSHLLDLASLVQASLFFDWLEISSPHEVYLRLQRLGNYSAARGSALLLSWYNDYRFAETYNHARSAVQAGTT